MPASRLLAPTALADTAARDTAGVSVRTAAEAVSVVPAAIDDMADKSWPITPCSDRPCMAKRPASAANNTSRRPADRVAVRPVDLHPVRLIAPSLGPPSTRPASAITYRKWDLLGSAAYLVEHAAEGTAVATLNVANPAEEETVRRRRSTRWPARRHRTSLLAEFRDLKCPYCGCGPRS